MRSLLSFAAMIAAIGFSGCCGTGASCPLSAHGCKLGGIAKTASAARAVAAPQATFSDAVDCGCSQGDCCGHDMLEYDPNAGSECGAGDCGCGAADSGAATQSAAACACGTDAVVTVSPATDCGCAGTASAPAAATTGDCGCAAAPAAAPVAAPSSDCGCGSAPVAAPSSDCGCAAAPVAAPASDCGCASCSDASAAPIQHSAPVEYSVPAASGCSACQGASTVTPVHRQGLVSGKGMGMGIKDRGLACADQGPVDGPLCGLKSGGQRNRLKLPKLFGGAKKKAVVQPPAEVELVSNNLPTECVECSGEVVGGAVAAVNDVNGRRISHGVIADVRQATTAHFGDSAAPVSQPAVLAGHRSCGVAGCGHGGRLCGGCDKLRSLAGIGRGNPYGGVIPHTAQAPGQSGLAPAYAYPYYTTRGPRDFLRDNPPSIGR